MRRPAWGAPYAGLVRVGLAAVALAAVGCAPRARMCSASGDCAGRGACVAGRCLREAATLRPAVDSARRVVLRPVDVAYVRRGDGPSGGGLPSTFALGTSGARLLLRFDASVPSSSSVVEAYVVLRRSSAVDDDPAPIALHATRIVDGWSGRSVSWAFQPRASDIRSPSTVVEPGGGSLVRLDVRELVRNWAHRDPSDHGLAIVADNESRTGTTFAFDESGLAAEPAGRGRELAVSEPGPYLEIYVR